MIIRKKGKIENWRDQKEIKIVVPNVAVDGNIRITFKDADVLADDKMFAFWFHTAFESGSSLLLPKIQLDKAFKNKTFHDDFKCTVLFGPAPTRQAPPAPQKN